MKISSSLVITLAAAAAGLLSQCAPYPANNGEGGGQYLSGYGNSGQQGQGTFQGYWDGDGVQGPSKIRINRAEQKAYFYKGGKLVGATPVSTGSSTHRTPSGSFKVTQKSKDHKSSLYGVIKKRDTGEVVNSDADTRKHRAGPGEVFVNAPMPNFLRFNGGIGMHTGHLPGYPASHGCVRLPDYMAVKFFENSQIGTPVIVE